MSDTDSPGLMTVKIEGSVFLAALPGEYLTFTPVKTGLAPSLVVIAKVLVAKVCKALRGSLRSLRVSSPVLTRVVITLKFSTSFTASGPETLSERRGAAWTAAAVAARMIRADRWEAKNIMLTADEGRECTRI